MQLGAIELNSAMTVFHWWVISVVMVGLEWFVISVVKFPPTEIYGNKVASPGSSLGVVHAVYVQLGGHTGEASGNHVGVGQP